MNRVYSCFGEVHQGQCLDAGTRLGMYMLYMKRTHLVLVRAAASLHHTPVMQCCCNPDHYPDFKPFSQSLTLRCSVSRAAELQILMSGVTGPCCGAGGAVVCDFIQEIVIA